MRLFSRVLGGLTRTVCDTKLDHGVLKVGDDTGDGTDYRTEETFPNSRGVPIRCWRFWEQKDVTSTLTTTERPLCAIQEDRVCAGRLLSSDGRTARSKRGCGDTPINQSRHSTVAVQWAIACDISLSQLAEWNRSQEISHRHAMLRHLWTQLITSEKHSEVTFSRATVCV